MAFKKQNGFTIVELMIAISVFSFAIMLVMIGVMQIGRLYQQGVTKTRLITLSREIQSRVSQDYQYSGDYIDTGAVSGYSTLCIGSTRYMYIIGGDLMIDKLTGTMDCNSSPSANAQKPLPTNSKVITFNFSPQLGMSNIYQLSTRFVVGDADLFEILPNANPYENSCKSEAGREFCAVVSLDSVIARKVK